MVKNACVACCYEISLDTALKLHSIESHIACGACCFKFLFINVFSCAQLMPCK